MNIAYQCPKFSPEIMCFINIDMTSYFEKRPRHYSISMACEIPKIYLQLLGRARGKEELSCTQFSILPLLAQPEN